MYINLRDMSKFTSEKIVDLHLVEHTLVRTEIG